MSCRVNISRHIAHTRGEVVTLVFIICCSGIGDKRYENNQSSNKKTQRSSDNHIMGRRDNKSNRYAIV